MNYFLAVSFPFVILMIFGPVLIRILKKLNFGQQIREAGPRSHQEKEGIPTMGGILIVTGILISFLLLFDLTSHVIMALIVTTGMGLIGFLDDFIKIRCKTSLGLRARSKITGQLFFGLFLALYVYFYTDIGTEIIIPGTGELYQLDFLIIPLIILTVIGTANAVNLTDGLDGLAAGTTAIVISTIAVITSVLGLEQLTLFGLCVTGACLGFVWFNCHPAQVFMGDVGSLALGGAVASMAVLARAELFLLIVGGVYVLETLSVMIQVIYFKLTGGRRVFRMTPIHHHYELGGLSESKVVVRFVLLNIIFSVLGLLSFYFAY